MENTKMLYGIIGLLLGLLIAGGSCYMNQHRNANQMEHTMNMTMDSMMSGLEDKTADEFDKAFIKEMIVHHEGAVAMAESAKVNAKHQEIKTMANAIISAQTAEIAQMKKWLNDWYNEAR